MATPGDLPELFAQARAPAGLAHINGRCLLQTRDERRVVSVSGIILAQYAAGDRMSEAHAMVGLVEQGHADQNDVARAFGCSTRTVRRFQARFAEGGLPALARTVGYPKGRRRLPPARDRLVGHLKTEGSSNCDIARRIGVTEKAIRKQLRRLGWREQPPEQPQLALTGGSDPNLSASTDAPVESAPPSASPASDPNLSAPSGMLFSLDSDPSNRVMDRLLAVAGLLDDAAPLFRPGPGVPRAGVLLAIPALTKTGVFDCAKAVFGDIGPAFYGLRTTVLTLLLMALLRIKRPEALKEHAPPDLGRLLGLDRAPEVKTLRRKLSTLAAFGRAVQFGRELARRRVQTHGNALGFLYTDGHVRVYHGKHPIPKAHVARMRLSMPATSDYWVNDQGGEPLFVVTAEANAGMARMLPPLLAEIRALIGERRVTIVFDRGGWSPKLFRDILAQGFDILTYRKGRSRRIPRGRFRDCAVVIDGREVAYALADQGVALLGGSLRLRQVTRLGTDGHQTPIITSRRDLPAVEVAYRMFERWRQENFFKYLREEYALDALADHRLEPADPGRSVPNPARYVLDHKLRQARLELQRLASQYGLDALANVEARRRTMRGFKIASSAAGRAIAAAERRAEQLECRRSRLPQRVPVAQVVDGQVVRLSTERKHLTNCLKLVAYQAESELVRLAAKHYRRTEDDGRTLVQTVLASAADLVVSKTELRVILAPLSSPHRSKAVAALCEDLNAGGAVFPGTKLRLRYSVAAGN
jgi:prepilin-type processing-associated H-X9-DG protein